MLTLWAFRVALIQRCAVNQINSYFMCTVTESLIRGKIKFYTQVKFLNFFSELTALISAVKTLTQNTRATRTIIWCANQLVLANSIPNRETSALLPQSSSKEGTGDVS